MSSLKLLSDACHANAVLASIGLQYKAGKFSDVKIVCLDSDLWAHRVILGSVSPYLKNMLLDVESQDVVTLFLPHIRAFHMRLVLDYIYQGSMYLRATHMQYVVRVIEVLQLNCGVSVSKLFPKTDETDETQLEEQNFMKFRDLELYYQPVPKSEDDLIEDSIEVKPFRDDETGERKMTIGT